MIEYTADCYDCDARNDCRRDARTPASLEQGAGCVAARRQKVLVWIGSAFNRARKQNILPPEFDGDTGERLWIGLHGLTTVFGFGIIGFVLPLLVLTPLVNLLFVGLPWFVGALSLAASMGGGFIASTSYGARLLSDAIAANAAECWGKPDSPLPSGHDSPA
jgi:hypothetical protein